MRVTRDIAREVAARYSSRAEWSTSDPTTYDWAILNLDEDDFLKITEHMHNNEGKILPGDPNDPMLVSMRRRLSAIHNSTVVVGPNQDPGKAIRLEQAIKQAQKC